MINDYLDKFIVLAVGRNRVGKSSLTNFISANNLAKVSNSNVSETRRNSLFKFNYLNCHDLYQINWIDTQGFGDNDQEITSQDTKNFINS